MIAKYHKLALTASIALAMAFIFSCSTDTNDVIGSSSNSGGGTSSLGGTNNSSSSGGGALPSSSGGGTMSSSSGNSSGDYEMLNGVWSRGDIVLTFDNSNAVFTELDPNSGWQKVLNKGLITIGSQKFKDIRKTGNLTWSCQALTYNKYNYTLDGWQNCTLTISADGQTLQTGTSNIINPSDTYTKYSGSSSSSSNNLNPGVVAGPTVTQGTETYQTVVIGTQTWFSRNLNNNVPGSKCFGEDGYVGADAIELPASEIQANCTQYGRLYNWAAAKTACPSGWRLPSNDDWDKLMHAVDGSTIMSSPYDSETAGKYLKAIAGWDGNGNGLNSRGFSALPSGLYVFVEGTFGYAGKGELGIWWSSSEYKEDGLDFAFLRYIANIADVALWDLDVKEAGYSVRCMKDN